MEHLGFFCACVCVCLYMCVCVYMCAGKAWSLDWGLIRHASYYLLQTLIDSYMSSSHARSPIHPAFLSTETPRIHHPSSTETPRIHQPSSLLKHHTSIQPSFLLKHHAFSSLPLYRNTTHPCSLPLYRNTTNSQTPLY